MTYINRRSASADLGLSSRRSAPCRRFVYLDLFNILVGGQQIAAANRGLASSPADAARHRIVDPHWRLNCETALSFAVGEGRDSAFRAVCVGSNKRGNPGLLWIPYEHAGWTCIIYERDATGREKETDVGLAVVILDDLLPADGDPAEFEVTILSGDRDLVPVVDVLRRRGFAVDVAAWAHTVSPKLSAAARRFIPLDSHFQHLSFHPQHH